MKKRVCTLLLALCLALSLLPFGAAAATEGGFTYELAEGGAVVTGFADEMPQCLVIPETLGGQPVVSIADAAFYNQLTLEEVRLPEGLRRIGTEAFEYCAALKAVSFPSTLERIDSYAFADSGLVSAVLPEHLCSIGLSPFEGTPYMDTAVWEDDVLYLDMMALRSRGDRASYTIRPGTRILQGTFNGNKKVASVHFPNSVTTIGSDTFYLCDSLTQITLPDSLRYLDEECFMSALHLKSIRIPAGVKRIGDRAFAFCKDLRSLTFAGETLESIGAHAFSGASLLDVQTLTIPSSVKEIGESAFYDCQFHNLVLSPAMTEVSTQCFANNAVLASVTIPASITCIRDGAFRSSLGYGSGGATIRYGGTPAQWKQVVIEPNNQPLSHDSKIEYDTKPAPGSYVDPFIDVPEGQYYSDPVRWAVDHQPQITNGTEKDKFSPNDTCTRGQVVTFLWRAKGCPEPTMRENPFTDVRPDAYYYKAVLWAFENGVTTGDTKTTFAPGANCTRAHVVTFLWRAEGTPAAGESNPFADVPAGQYYTDAVRWAVNHQPQITTGTSADRFSPGDACTRGQIVTFLYRDLAA